MSEKCFRLAALRLFVYTCGSNTRLKVQIEILEITRGIANLLPPFTAVLKSRHFFCVVWSGSGVVSLHGGRIGQCSQSSCDAALLSTLTIFRLNRNDHFFSCDAFLVSKFTMSSRYFDGLGDICVRSSRILETAVWTCIRIVYSGVPGM